MTFIVGWINRRYDDFVEIIMTNKKQTNKIEEAIN